MDFSDKLKTLRMQANMTQSQLAEHLCVTRQAVSNYEQGRSYPSMDTLARMCNLFNTSLDELLETGIKKQYMKQLLIVSVVLLFSIVSSLISFYIIAIREAISVMHLVFSIAVNFVPFLCLIIYFIFHYNPPKKINSFYGYRTRLSMQSQLAWDYAQAYFSFLYARIACILFAINAAYFIITMFLSSYGYMICSIIIFCMQMLFLPLPILFVERKLKRFKKKNEQR